MSLAALLFDRPLGNGNKALFNSQSDLAEAIVAVSANSKKKKNPVNVRAFLSQVLRNKRNPSKKLKQAIASAVEARLVEIGRREDVQPLLERLGQEFNIGPAETEKPLDDKQEFRALDIEAEKAKVHYILTHSPAEVMENDKATILMADLAQRLGLLGLAYQPTGIQYIFNLPDELTARHLWRGLGRFLEKRTSDVDGPIRLRQANNGGLGPLQVNVVPAAYCLPPTVVFDPGDRGRSRGFVLEYHESNTVSVARLSATTLAMWFTQVYLVLTSSPTSLVRSVTFDDAVANLAAQEKRFK